MLAANVYCVHSDFLKSQKRCTFKIVIRKIAKFIKSFMLCCNIGIDSPDNFVVYIKLLLAEECKIKPNFYKPSSYLFIPTPEI